jgi:hypothetical protein
MASEYIFLTDDHDDNYSGLKVLVAKKDWFKQMPVCQLRDQYGMTHEREFHEEDENGETECNCEEATAYEYWDGSNFQTAVLDAPGESRYSEITDETEIARYEKALADKDGVEYEERRTGYRTWNVGDLRVVQSFWQGDWDLFRIEENEEGGEGEN